MQNQEIRTPVGIVKKIGKNQQHQGWRVLDLNSGRQIHNFLNRLLEEWSIVGFIDGKLDGHGYGNNFHEQAGAQCGELFIVKDYQLAYNQVLTSVGIVRKISKNEQIPGGWRALQIQQGQQCKNDLNKLLQEWSIVGFKTGKIDGYGYGNQIHQNAGGQCGELFIVNPF